MEGWFSPSFLYRSQRSYLTKRQNEQTEPKLPDVMSHLFAPYKNNNKTWDDAAINLMAGESHLLINAGR